MQPDKGDTIDLDVNNDSSTSTNEAPAEPPQKKSRFESFFQVQKRSSTFCSEENLVTGRQLSLKESLERAQKIPKGIIHIYGLTEKLESLIEYILAKVNMST